MAWLVIVASLFLLYLFLTAPRLIGSRKRMKPFWGRAIAHRGLHGGSMPENSLVAFRLASERGYGAELDVRLTRDGQLIVLHDASLLRMCGIDRPVADMTAEEISAFPLQGSNERIPYLSQVLDALARPVPLIVELKSSGNSWRRLPALVLEEMKRYGGPWCVESFDPRMLVWFRLHTPRLPRGQLAYDPARAPDDSRRGVPAWCGARLLFNWLSRPDFIAYRHDTAGNLSLELIRHVFHPVTAAWTVKTPAEFERLRTQYDILIFEGFSPKTAFDAGKSAAAPR